LKTDKKSENELIFLKPLNKMELNSKLSSILNLFKLDNYQKISIISFFSNYFSEINSGIKISVVDSNVLSFHLETGEQINFIDGIFDSFEQIEKKGFWAYKYQVNLSDNFVFTKKIRNEVKNISFTIDKLMAINTELEKEVKNKFAQLKKIEKQAYYDNLTKIFNRNKFNELLDRAIDRAKRYKTHLSFAIFDIDHFKYVNDKYGHLVGDKVLVEFSSIIYNNIRKSDIFARWGGEEFVLLMPQTDILNAKKVSEKIRLLIENNNFEIVGKVRCSIGISEYKENMSIEELINSSDEALYYAKENGRNQTVLSCELNK